MWGESKGNSPLLYRQCEHKACALIVVLVERKFAAQFPGYLLADRQSQTDSLFEGIAFVEAFEYFVLLFLVDAPSRIAQTNLYALAALGKFTVQFDAAFLRKLDGILNELFQHLGQTVLVGLYLETVDDLRGEVQFDGSADVFAMLVEQ